jgi:hypothetical protein
MGGMRGEAFQLPQAGAEPGLEEESPAFTATVEEPRKERTPRLDWAGLLRRTFALDVVACLRCGGRRRCLAPQRPRQRDRLPWGTLGGIRLDQCGRLQSSSEAWAPVTSDVGRFVWRESWRPRCPRVARLDMEGCRAPMWGFSSRVGRSGAWRTSSAAILARTPSPAGAGILAFLARSELRRRSGNGLA